MSYMYSEKPKKMTYIVKEQFLNDVEFELEQCNTVTKANNLITESIYPALMKIEKEDLPSYEIRTEIVECISELFYELFGRFPSSLSLDLLANVLLADYIKDKAKTKEDELQFLTPSQEKRRKQKEFSAVDETMNFIYSKDVLKMDSLAKKYTEELD